MKNASATLKLRKVTIRFSTAEYDALCQSFRNTTLRKLSEYLRNMIFRQPITLYTRNRSLDECIAELILIRTELQAIGKNYNQVVRKFHATASNQEAHSWALLLQQQHQLFLKKMEQIQEKMNQLNDIW
jgi:hypothetical protein